MRSRHNIKGLVAEGLAVTVILCLACTRTLPICQAFVVDPSSVSQNRHNDFCTSTRLLSERAPGNNEDAFSPPASTQPPNEQLYLQDDSGENSNDDSLKGNRFSKFAPDASLPAEEFRTQLRENMKANLEERRRNNPNRGNQPAKSYLDSL